MVAIVDYGVGNLFSLGSSFAAIGEEACVPSAPAELCRADRRVLPGVGALGDAAEKLKKTGLDRVLISEAGRGKPLLGICLGMQLLFERSFEYGTHEGLGLIPGEVRPISEMIPEGLKIPHIGWNALNFVGRRHPLFSRTADGAKKNVMGCQFHPEKSGNAGLEILRAFCGLKETDLC